MRPTAQQSIEASLTARVSEIEQAERNRCAVDLTVERLSQWIEDGGYVHVDLLAELLGDIELVTE